MKTALLTALFFSLLCRASGQSFTYISSTTITTVDTTFHGISGIDYVPGKGWFFVSDRGGKRTVDNHGVVFTTDDSFLTLPNRPKTKWPAVFPYSFEAIRYSRKYDGFFLAWENKDKTGIVFSPANTQFVAPILLSSINESIPVPADNKGIEALSVTESGHLWVAPEAGWHGETQTPDDTIHFYRYSAPASALQQGFERFAYKIDRFPVAYFESDKPGGISDMISLNDSTLFVLERGFHVYQEGKKGGPEKRIENVLAKLYKVRVDNRQKKLFKEVVFDFTKPDLFPGILCNVEGMCWGPPGPANKRRLYLIADDNFNSTATQQTQFIILEEK
jgi:Esterase-like activity of phytase